MRIIVFTLLLSLLYTNVSIAQDGLSDYRKARELMLSEEYGDAMDLFRSYLDYAQFGEVSNYATLNFARSAYENRQFELAKTSLNQMMEDRNWKKMDDARYLLALCHFQQQNPDLALEVISKIKDESLLEEAYQASYYFLQNHPISFFIPKLSNYENNLGLLMALKRQLEMQPSLSSNERQIYERIKTLDLDGLDGEILERVINQTLEIAVILPFNYAGGTGVRRLNNNNFVFELYRGLKFAAEQAKRDGVTLAIRTFDTERSPEKIRQILEDPFFQVADIIVGPIYPEETEIVSGFAERNKIPFVNPLSNLNENSEDKQYSYLFRPSTKSISEGVIAYNKKLDGRRIALAYSGTSRDEVLAQQYSEMARRAGYQVVLSKKVTTRDMRDFFEQLSIGSGRSPRVDQVVIFSDDPNIASPTFAVMESLTSHIPVLVMDSWLYFNFANYEMLEVQNFHFIGNNTVNVGKEELEKFREDFFEAYQVYPGLNAHLGKELMYWITSSINNQKGFDLRKNLDQMGFLDGNLTFGFNFRDSKTNTFVPILKLEDGVFEVE